MHKDKNINDELLEIAASLSDNYKEAITLASLALHEIYKFDFFSKQYESYNIVEVDDSGILTLYNGSTTYDGMVVRSQENDFSYKLIKRVKEVIPCIEENENKKVNDSAEEEYDYYDDFDTKKSRHVSKEKKELLTKFIYNLENKSPNDFLSYIREQLKKDDKFLIKIYSVLGNNDVLKILKSQIELTEEQNKCDQYSVNLYFPKIKENNRGFFRSIKRQLNQRESLESLGFDFLKDHYKKTHKEIYEELLKSENYDFSSFLVDCNLDCERRKEYLEKDRKQAIKELLKNDKNPIAIICLTKSKEKRVGLLFDEVFRVKSKDLANEIKKINSDILENKTIDQIKEEYKSKIDEIVDEIVRRYPFIKSDQINKEEIEIKMTAAKLNESGYSRFIECYNYSDAKNLLEGIQQKNIHYQNIISENIEDSKYDMERKFKKFLSKSKFSISAEGANLSDGYRLFNPNETNLVTNELGFYMNFDFNGHTIAKASMFLKPNGGLKIGTVEVARPFRKKGFSYYIYDKLSDIAIKSVKPMITGSYTVQGNKKIPRVKDKIMEYKKEAIFLYPSDYGLNYDFKSKEEFLTISMVKNDKELNLDELIRLKELIFKNWNSIISNKREIDEKDLSFSEKRNSVMFLVKGLLEKFNSREPEEKLDEKKKIKPV